MLASGLAASALAFIFLGAAKGRYTVQPEEERGPLGRTPLYGIVGPIFAALAFLLLPQAGR